MKKGIAILFCLLSAFANAQSGFTRNINIPVNNGSPLELPWAGGINFPLFSKMNLNNDTLPDLFVFDRSNNRVLTFVNNGAPGTDCWQYAPQYEDKFPQMSGWAFLYDYNCDYKPDLFTVDFSNHGITQYRNDSQSGNISFTLVDSTIQFICNCPIHFSNIIASEYLVPNFDDIDGDGDMDILGQQLLCVGGFAYYRNMSMEDFGNCDSLNDFVLETNTWGKFTLRSGQYRNVVVGSWNVSCFQSGNGHSYEEAKRDDTYAYIRTIDIDGDGDKDALVGDAQADNSLLVINGGDNNLATMVSQDTLFPSYNVPVHIHSFAEHSFVDADNDGIKDLIVSQSEYENKHGAYFYKNTGTNAVPVYSQIEKDFLQNQMIDVGESAAPVLFDYDGDGLKDLFIGNKYVTINDTIYKAGISLYKNNGTPTSPSFDFVTDDYAGLQAILFAAQLHGQVYPAFGDIDGDNDADLIVGLDEGQLMCFMNTAGPGVTPVYATPTFPYMSIDIGQASTPQFFDLNKDGLLDLIIGEKNGMLNYFQNLGTVSIPFYSSSPTIDSLGGPGMVQHLQNFQSPDGYSLPFFFDQGGDTRMLVSCMKGDIYLYGNIDGNLNGNYTFLDTVFKGVGGNRYGYNLSVSGGDLNNDTLVDMVIGIYGGGPQIFYQDNNANAIFSPDKFDFIRVYPNPVSETLIIKSSIKIKNASCRLFDISGRTIISAKLNGDYGTLDVSDIAAGAYFLCISTETYNVVRKIIIEKK